MVSVRPHVSRITSGNHVVTLFYQGHTGGPLDIASLSIGLSGVLGCTFRQYGAFDKTGLVTMPSNLSFVEASTLSCAGLTAWNGLFGLEGSALK